MMGFIEYRRSVMATFTLLITITMIWAANKQYFSWIIKNPAQCAGWFFGYVFVAVPLWAIFRWWRKVENLAQECREIKYQFLRDNNVTGSDIPQELRVRWEGHFSYLLSQYTWRSRGIVCNKTGIVPLHPNDHKEEIYMWMMFLPWSVVWYVFDEPVRKTIRGIYRSIRGFLVSISENAFNGLKDDFVKLPEQKPETFAEKADSATGKSVRF
jgi:hypothetical protein